MNCRKGDIARIVGLPRGLTEANDRFVRVVELAQIGPHVAWRIEGEVQFTIDADCWIHGHPFYKGERVAFDSIHDIFLRPIRDPGEDAVDEMVRRFPVPGKAVTA